MSTPTAVTTGTAIPVSGPRLLTDARTMLRRRVRHLWRYPSLTLMLIGQPIVLLLLFVFVFGGTMGAGLAGPGGGRAEYLAYLTPTVLAMTVASVALGTAMAIATDMTEGVVARFRTMAIARSSVLAGHVGGAVVQTVIALVAVLAVVLLLGFRSPAGVGAWLGVIGLLALLTLALTWFTLALGLAAASVETASNTPMFLVLLPFLGSGFVPVDSMPVAVRWFAEYQPFTPVIDTLRGLLEVGPGPVQNLGLSTTLAVGWCTVITIASVLWARRLYEARSAR